jgi:hypothetical protein
MDNYLLLLEHLLFLQELRQSELLCLEVAEEEEESELVVQELVQVVQVEKLLDMLRD